MVFQDYGLYPNMNVLQNIAYGLEARGGLSRTEIEQRSKEAAAKLGLSDLLQRLIVDLSGGEQQRVALARALAKQADVYLFDEPLSNLDPKLRYQARRDIITLHRNKRKPSLYVTHDQTEAFAMGDRIGIMAHGRLQQVGRAEELLNAPANLFVARFLGSPPMNLLKAEIADHNGTLWIISDGLSVLLPKKWRSLLNQRNTRNLVVGLRPNRLTWKDETTPADRHVEHTVTGTVVDVELLFGETVVSLRIGKDTTLMVVLQDSYGDMTLGQKLSLTIDLDELCLFDPETEQSLTLEHRQ
jgi:ABC-type sugar transport system ATPase subunit